MTRILGFKIWALDRARETLTYCRTGDIDLLTNFKQIRFEFSTHFEFAQLD